MTMTGRTIYELESMGAPGIGALAHFVRHLGRDSQVFREMHPECAELLEWDERRKTNAILADLFDQLGMFRTEHASVHTKKGNRPKQPRPYPRPGVEDKNRKHIGSDPLPMDDFDAWWESG